MAAARLHLIIVVVVGVVIVILCEMCFSNSVLLSVFLKHYYRYFIYIYILLICESFFIFPRDAMRKRGLCCRPVCVCPSVRLSRWWIVSRRLKISLYFFLSLIAPSF